MIGRHRWALLFTPVVVLILMLPALLMRAERDFYRTRFPDSFEAWTNNGTFSPIDSYSMSEDNYVYAARIRQAGSHALPGDPFIRDNRSARLASRDFATFWLFGQFFRALGDIRAAWTASTVFFSLLWVPLLYLVMLRLGAGPRQATAVAASVTLFADLARIFVLEAPLPRLLAQAVQYAGWLLGSYQYYMGPVRLTGPVMTYPALFLAALAFCAAAEREDYPSAVGAGLLGGALVYVHSDVWTVWGGACALYAASTCWRKRALDGRLLALLAAAALVAVPWIALNRSIGESEAELIGTTLGRRLDFASWPMLVGAWLAWRVAGRTTMGAWIACAFGAIVLQRNSSLLLGRHLDLANWIYIGNVLLALTVGRALGGRKPADSERWLWGAALACALAVPRAVSYAAQHYRLYALPREQEQALSWLDKNTPKGAVVAALSPMTNLTIPAHTHDTLVSSFICPHLSDVSPRENAARIRYALSLYGVSAAKYWDELRRPSEWGRKLWDGVVDLDGRERGMWAGTLFCNLSQDKIEALLLEPASSGRAFPVDYVWQGSFEGRLMGGLKPPPGAGREVFRNGAVAIFEARR